MKLTVDLINDSITHINPLKDRELVLRSKYGYYWTRLFLRWLSILFHDDLLTLSFLIIIVMIDMKIPVIENLGGTKVTENNQTLRITLDG
jgi:hypothetical protein